MRAHKCRRERSATYRLPFGTILIDIWRGAEPECDPEEKIRDWKSSNRGMLRIRFLISDQPLALNVDSHCLRRYIGSEIPLSELNQPIRVCSTLLESFLIIRTPEKEFQMQIPVLKISGKRRERQELL